MNFSLLLINEVKGSCGAGRVNGPLPAYRECPETKISFHSKTPYAPLLVSNPETRDFLSWQGILPCPSLKAAGIV